jgi:hypothetical protein
MKRMILFVLTLVWLGNVTLLAQPLVQYNFNDGSASDSSGNGHDGTLLDAAAVVLDPERGQVLQINQSGMQADGPFAIGTSFTLSAWIKIDIPRTGRYFFGGPWWFRTDDQAGSDHVWIEVRYPDGNFLNKVDTTLGGQNPLGQLDGQWHHYVFILPEDGAFQVFFDGILAPFRDADPTRAHDFEGAIGPLFFGTENDAGANALQGYMDDVRVYNYAVTEDEIPDLMVEGLGREYAGSPDPASETTDVVRDVVLAWTPGGFAVTHDVYLGSSWDDVNTASPSNPLDTLISQTQDANTLDLGALDFGQTYFWRIDEVNGAPDNTVFKGEVWNFTIEPFSYPLQPIAALASSSHEASMGPAKTIDGSGLNDLDQHSNIGTDMWLSGAGISPAWIQYELDQAYKLHEMWVWNSNQVIESFIGLGVKDVIVETSLDAQTWTVLENVPQIAQASGASDYTANTVLGLGGVMARFIRITVNSGWGMTPQNGLSEVRIFHIPLQARAPQPVTGDVDVATNAVLTWRAGREAAQHEVALSDDNDAVVNDTAIVATVDESRFDLSALGLELGTSYFWKINEINEAASPSHVEGDIWSFTTPEFIVVDDFEQYNDDCKRVFFIWEDGFGHNGSEECGVAPYSGNGTGSLVGNANAPFAERTIVHSGRQSMPLEYENSSEAQRVLGQDWTSGGARTLVLYFHGDPANTGQLYVEVNGSKVVYDGPADAITTPDWTPWSIDLASLGVNLQNVTQLSVGAEGGSGMVYIDDIRLYKEAPAPAGG